MVGETYTIAVCVEDIYGAYEDPDTARQTSIVVETKAVTPNAPESVSVKFGSDIVVKWDFVDNADVRYYEVRLDNNPGVVGANFLGRTTSNSLVINLTKRQGTIYVYAYGANKIYSVPGSVTYNLSKPPQPKPPELIANINSLTIRTTIPDTCHGMYIYINDEPKIYHNNGSYTYVGKPGIYDVAITYVDAIGESDKSPTVSESIRAYIDPDLIEAGSISTKKLDAATNKALDDAKQTAKDLGVLSGNVYSKTETDNQISTSLSNFKDGDLKSYATITQMQDAISLAVKDIDIDGNEILTKINIADGTILLDGKYIHITGDAKIDDNLITNNMLAGSITGDKILAKAITTDKLNINGGKTSGARIEVVDNLITVYDDNNIARVKLGLIDEI